MPTSLSTSIIRSMPAARRTLCGVIAGLFLMSANAAVTTDIEIEYQTFVLDNGLTLIVHEDDKAPIVAVNTWYHVGSKNEVPGRTGFAHLFEHLMFQGSENFDDEYLPYLERLGATTLNATTWFDRTNYYQNVPKNALDTVLWLESDRMGHFVGAITQDKLNEQRGVVQNERRQSRNQPYGKVWELMLGRLFPAEHPYSWETIGSMADLDAATLDDVREWFETYYGPNNAVISIAGDVDAEVVAAKVEKYFGDIPPGPPLSRPTEWIPVHTTERRQTMQDRVPQSRLYMAWPGPRWGTTEAQHLALAAEVLSGGKNSRLYERLVYTDQIATDVAVAPLPLEISGITYLIASAQPGTGLAGVETAIREELERFAAKGPSKKELERARIAKRAAFLRGIERIGGSGGKAGVLARNQVYGDSPDLYKKALATIDAATPEDLQRSVERWLGTNAFILEVEPYPELKAAADGAERTVVPEAGKFPEVGFADFTRSRLDNGLEILVAERPGAPVVELAMVVDAGYAADQFTHAGTASLTMAMLDEGTRKRTSLEIADELAMQGANLSAGSNLDTSTVRMSALQSRLDESLDIFADVVLNPVFPDTELERLRRMSLARIQQEQTRPMSMALRIMPGLLYGEDHPYGQPLTGTGTRESVLAISRDDLVAFHETWMRPDNATLIVVGDVDKEALQKRIKKLFGGWKPGKTPVKQLAITPVAPEHVLYLLDRPGADQSVIFAGQLVPPKSNPDELALQAVNLVLGGQSSARINMNLREDKGWSYGAYSAIVGARGARPLLAYAPVQTDKTAASIEEMKQEILAITGANPPAADELNTVKRSQTLSLPGRWEAAGDILGSLNELVRYELPEDHWSTYADRINALDLGDVRDVAQRILRPDELVWVVVGDRASIEYDLRRLDFDEIRLMNSAGRPMGDNAAEQRSIQD